MRLFWLFQLLLVGLSYGQDDKTLVSGTEAAADPAAAAALDSTNDTTQDRQRFPRPEEVNILFSISIPQTDPLIHPLILSTAACTIAASDSTE